jgi:hypothetical protein
MRISLVIRKMVVPAVDCNPKRWRELQTTRSEDGERVLKPKRARKAAMRYEPMETNIDSKNAKHIYSDSKKNDPRPAEEPGNKR